MAAGTRLKPSWKLGLGLAGLLIVLAGAAWLLKGGRKRPTGGRNTAAERESYVDLPESGVAWSRVVPLGTLPPPAAGDENRPFIDWEHLRNPILAEPDRMIKDPAVAWREGWFYIFASQRISGDQPWSYYRTRDFKDYERFDVQELHGGSPDLKLLDGRWILLRQNETTGADRRLFYSTSTDLLHWQPGGALAQNIQRGMRHIDGTLAAEGGFFYLGYKGEQQFFVTRSPSLAGPWETPRAVESGGWCENYQYLKIDGQWRLIATAHAPPGYQIKKNGYTGDLEPFIYTIRGAGRSLEDFARLENKTHLVVPWEDWNEQMHANSAFLCDWRRHDGYLYLFYAGANDRKSFEDRGHAKLGVVRSKDLVHWAAPGGN